MHALESKTGVRVVLGALALLAGALGCSRTAPMPPRETARGTELLMLRVAEGELRVGQTVQLGAMHHTGWVQYADGRRVPGGVIGRRSGVQWEASPAEAVAIDGFGRTRLLRAGLVHISARCEGSRGERLQSNTLELEILPATDTPTPSTAPEVVSLERTGCLGSCPVYRVVVHADGVVDYEGRANVKTEGRRMGHIAVEQVARLAAAFDAAGFFSLEASEGQLDLPTVILTQRKNDATHTVQYVSSPPPVQRLEQLVETTVGVEAWIGTQAERDALPSPLSEILAQPNANNALDKALRGIPIAPTKRSPVGRPSPR